MLIEKEILVFESSILVLLVKNSLSVVDGS